MNEGQSPTSYDILPYPAYTIPATHIGKIGAMGRIFGLNAADPARARVLELGCGSCFNILAMAQIFPEGEFVGIDASKRQIEAGREVIAKTGVTNLRLLVADISKLEEDLGKFDYIISHGLFSWVPQEIKDAILRISSENLAPNGIAYVSYNCLPGWHMRGGLRDMMLMHTSGISNPLEKVAQSRALVKFLAESCPEDTHYGKYLRQELEKINKADDGYIAHDFLEADNDPLYFTDFLKAAAKFGLGYLGDADPSTMIIQNLPGPAAQTLKSLKLGLLATEQYMDFVRNRTFRSTLLCHSSETLSRTLDPARIAGLHVTSRVALKQEPAEGKPAVFTSENGTELSANEPVTVEMFRQLSQLGKSSQSVEGLLEGALASMVDHFKEPDTAAIKSALSRLLQQVYFRKMVDFTLGAPSRRTAISSNPEALPLARQQAARGLKITSQRLDMSVADPYELKLITLCDGSRDRGALIADLVAAMENKEFHIGEHNQPVTDPERAKFLIERLYDAAMHNLTNRGILLAPA
jgi:methyltransferase-like protein/cyclopropane fatty-acyl-phospholipid synthase-like methyltransferase